MNLGEIVVKGFSMIKEQTDSIIGELKATRESIDTLAKYARNIEKHADDMVTDTSVIKEASINSENYLEKTANNTFTTHTDILRYTNLVKKGDDTL